MELPTHDLPNLFAQLGLPSDPASIDAFVARHKPLAPATGISEAPFWTPSQVAFLEEALAEDADWAPVIDELNALLHD